MAESEAPGRSGVHSSTGGSNGKLSSSRACRTAVTPLNLSCAHTEMFAGGLAAHPTAGGTSAAHREWRRWPVTAARCGRWRAARGTACGSTLSTTASLMESECHPAHVIAVELANPQHRSPYASRGRPVLSNADCRLGTHARARRARQKGVGATVVRHRPVSPTAHAAIRARLAQRGRKEGRPRSHTRGGAIGCVLLRAADGCGDLGNTGATHTGHDMDGRL